MGIQDNLVLLRKSKGMTQDDLAKVAGVSRGAVSQWEGGFSEPRMKAVQRIADYFGIRKSDLIEDLPGVDSTFERLSRNYYALSPSGQTMLAEISDVLRKELGAQ